jgi:hypothetical protein
MLNPIDLHHLLSTVFYICCSVILDVALDEINLFLSAILILPVPLGSLRKTHTVTT